MNRRKKKTSSRGLTQQPTGAQQLAAAVAHVMFDELVSESNRLSEDEDWEGLLKLSAMPLSAFSENEQQAARVQLLYCRVRGMTQMKSWHKLKRDELEAEELLAVLEELRSIDPEFHRSIEFYLYLMIGRYTVTGADRALRAIIPAFSAYPRASLLREMRRAIEWLVMRSSSDWDEELTESEHQILASQPDLSAVLIRACETIERVDEPDAALLAKVFRLDWLARMVEHDEADRLADAIKSLPAPSARSGAAGFVPRQGWEGCPTPQAWAFLVEAAAMVRGGWAMLDARYPEELGNPVCNGLRQLVRAMAAPAEQAVGYVIKGVELLSQGHMGEREDCFGQFLLIGLESGLDDIDCGLHLPHSADIVLRLVEHATSEFAFSDELLTLRSALEASRAYDTIDGSSAVAGLVGVGWLAEHVGPV